MKTTLVIMAAGIGSRFGGGIKQLAPVGLNGEIIMDYSIHDAIEAGFNKIVFIIRKDIKDAWNCQQDVLNLGEPDRLFLLVKKFCMSHLQLSMQMTTMERKHLLSFMIFL